jgi:hypothetical protein
LHQDYLLDEIIQLPIRLAELVLIFCNMPAKYKGHMRIASNAVEGDIVLNAQKRARVIFTVLIRHRNLAVSMMRRE